MRNAEYDRFGPWIIEISETDPLPPLFKPFVTRRDPALLSIKIPRHIERRNASPGMNLYDYVVNMYDKDFDIFRRDGENVISDSFNYRDVVCLKHCETLLRGSLKIYCRDSFYEFTYSTVSGNIISRLVDIIRDRYTEKERRLNPPEALPKENELDFYFTNLIESEKRDHPDNRLFAYQPRIKLSKIEDSGFRKFFNFITSKQLLESLHFLNSRELKITDRGSTFKYLYQPIYGKQDCFIPLEKIQKVEVSDVKNEENLKNCRIETDGDDFSFTFTADNPAVCSYPGFA